MEPSVLIVLPQHLLEHPFNIISLILRYANMNLYLRRLGHVEPNDCTWIRDQEPVRHICTDDAYFESMKTVLDQRVFANPDQKVLILLIDDVFDDSARLGYPPPAKDLLRCVIGLAGAATRVRKWFDGSRVRRGKRSGTLQIATGVVVFNPKEQHYELSSLEATLMQNLETFAKDMVPVPADS